MGRKRSAFSYLPLKQFKLERPSMEKLNSKHINGVFGMFSFFGNPMWLYVCKSKSYIVTTIMTKHANLFC